MVGRYSNGSLRFIIAGIICIILISTVSSFIISASITADNSTRCPSGDDPESPRRSAEDLQMEQKGKSLTSDRDTALAWGDMDNDGYLDLAITRYNNSVKVYKNKNGELIITPVWKSSEIFTATSIAWGDMNADGYVDLAIGNGPNFDNVSDDSVKSNVVFKNHNGILETDVHWSSSDKRNTSDISWADMDNDGYLDLAASNYGTNGFNVVYKNKNGYLNTAPTWVSDDNTWTEGIAWGDVDNNGYVDLVAGNNYGEQNRIYYNNKGTLELLASWESTDNMDTLDIALGDLNNDSRLDIAAGTKGSNICIIYFNTGGTYATTYDRSLSGTVESNSISLGDADSDGDLDIALGCTKNENMNKNYIYLNENGQFQSTPAWESYDESETTNLAFGDIDNDGDLDLGATNYRTTEGNKIYLNNIGKLPPGFYHYPNDPPYGFVNTPEGIQHGIVPFTFIIFDDESNPAWVEVQYSIDNSTWQHAAQAVNIQKLDLNNLATLPTGKKHTFHWDSQTITKESRDAKLRVRIHSKTSSISVYRYATIINTTTSFRLGREPSTPTGFLISEITTHSILLEWYRNPEADIKGYKIYMNTTESTSDFTLNKDVKNNTYYEVKNLIENTTYYFKLLAYDHMYFNSDFTSIISCTTFNKPPILNTSWTLNTITLLEDEGDYTSINLNNIFSDPTNDPMSFSVIAENNITITIKHNGSVQIQPKENWFGTEVINFSANDGFEHSAEDALAYYLVTVEVEPVNDAPIIVTPLGAITLDEDQTTIRRLHLPTYFADPMDNDALMFRAEGYVNISVTINSSGYAEIIPNEDWYGREVVKIYANDSTTETVDYLTIVVRPAEDLPVIKSITGLNIQSGSWRLIRETGNWMNVTIEGSDADPMDTLEFSIDLQKILPGLVPNDNYFFNNLTGELSVYLSHNMAGGYQFNITLSDGDDQVMKRVGLTIISGPGNKDGKSEPQYSVLGQPQTMMIFLVIIIVLIPILFFMVKKRKKSLKISLIKCPRCGQTMMQKSESSLRCPGCLYEITGELDKELVTTSLSPDRVQIGEPDKEPEVRGLTQVEGGHYTKSILEGSLLDELAAESQVEPDDTDIEPATAPAPPAPMAPIAPLAPIAQPVAITPQAAPALPAAAVVASEGPVQETELTPDGNSTTEPVEPDESPSPVEPSEIEGEK